MKGLSAKQLKSPDEFFKSIVVFLRYVKGNAKLILTIGIVTVIITSIFVSFDYWGKKKNDQSWNTLFEVENSIKKLEKSSKTDDEIIKSYNEALGKVKTDSSKAYIMIKIAEHYYAKKDWANASGLYSKALSTDNGLLLRQIALFGLASAKEMKGDVASAISDFAKISSDEISIYRPLAMLGLARCYAKAGNKSKAQESYDNIIIAFPESDYARIASTAKLGIN
jgi:tetratricopeptide (TPR) repeat protein